MTLGNFALKASAVSFPSGDEPHVTPSSVFKSYPLVTLSFVKATISGGTTARCVTPNLSTALSIPLKLNLSIITTVSDSTIALKLSVNPYTWKNGIVKKNTAGYFLFTLTASYPAANAVRLRCVITTPFIIPVVPDEYKIAATSD